MNARRSVLQWLAFSTLITAPFFLRHEIPGTREHSRTGALVIGVLVGLVLTATTALISRLAQRLPFKRGVWVMPSVTHFGLFLLCVLSIALSYLVAIQVIGAGPPRRGEIIASAGELAFILYPAIACVVFILDSRARSYAAELQLANAHAAAAEANLHALRAQLQPHFLFNALNTVAMAVRRADRQEALAVVLDLSALLRTALKRTGIELVSLSEEVDFIQQYLEIEQIRFRDRLKVDWEIEPAAHEAALPSMILQPLVENALRHGIGKKVGGAHIRIRIATANGRLNIAIEDDGPGFAADWKAGFGLANVRNRLALHFGERASLETSSARPGASVRLSIPYTRINGNAEVQSAHR